MSCNLLSQIKTILIASLCLAFLLFSPPARANDPGWFASGTGAIYGRSHFSTTAKGFRTDCLDAGYSIISEAPLWKVYLVNEKAKSYFPFDASSTTRVSGGRTSLLRSGILRNVEEVYWRKSYKTQFKGHPMTVWLTTSKNAKENKSFKVMELWSADDIALASAIAAFDHKVNGFPKELANLPLRCFLVRDKNTPAAFFETTSIRPATFPASLFKLPKGYKLARNEMEVVLHTDDLSNILEGLGTDK